ncbi:glucose-6-phosphate isomerase [Oceanicola sp. 22II-s10i]|uniref:glycine zipper 2TM domain-containing protein n=1 Tax=Oceanicola sp. 22II-s10i TaxID=1317116 RepID=UPI000B523140|nr:glycine zipper 2TM domain-containing protein [Oceanicola sp. 22II-s10i]OWU83622.1 glucose-6-phosphate isomerase [Oceanicola sp. 22II-s10i]
MKQRFIPALGLTASLLAACGTTYGSNQDARTVAGVAGGAAAGLIAAEALNANNNWRLIAALGGAAAGTMVAQNTQTRQCAYARGDGTYYQAPCPA